MKGDLKQAEIELAELDERLDKLPEPIVVPPVPREPEIPSNDSYWGWVFGVFAAMIDTLSIVCLKMSKPAFGSVSRNTLRNVSENAQISVSENVPRNTQIGVSEGVSENTKSSVSRNVSESVSSPCPIRAGNTSENAQIGVSENVPRNTPNSVSEGVSENTQISVSENVSEGVSENTQIGVSESVSESAQNSVSEGVSKPIKKSSAKQLALKIERAFEANTQPDEIPSVRDIMKLMKMGYPKAKSLYDDLNKLPRKVVNFTPKTDKDLKA